MKAQVYGWVVADFVILVDFSFEEKTTFHKKKKKKIFWPENVEKT